LNRGDKERVVNGGWLNTNEMPRVGKELFTLTFPWVVIPKESPSGNRGWKVESGMRVPFVSTEILAFRPYTIVPSSHDSVGGLLQLSIGTAPGDSVVTRLVYTYLAALHWITCF
jgi:hypothetical protein